MALPGLKGLHRPNETITDGPPNSETFVASFFHIKDLRSSSEHTICSPTHTILCLFQARSQNCEKRLLASSCTPVRLSIHMEQLDSHSTYFDETSYLSFLLKKSVAKIQVSLKSDKNNGYFTCRRFDVFDDISLNSS
jgi:hypothetical protein